jgi:hypothetical protein
MAGITGFVFKPQLTSLPKTKIPKTMMAGDTAFRGKATNSAVYFGEFRGSPWQAGGAQVFDAAHMS